MNENIDNIQNKSVQENQTDNNSDSEEEQDSIILSKKSKMSSSIKESDSKSIKSRDIEIIPENDPLTDKFDLSFKIIVIGDSFVGKSSLSNKAIKNKFESGYSATLGFDYFFFYVKIENKILKLDIWDTCGQEVYQSLIKNFYRNSSLAIMVYAINNRESFEHIDNWLKEMKINSNPDAKIFLIGNKNDLENEREVTIEEGEKYSNDLGFSYFSESSAKSGFCAQKIFTLAANLLYEDYFDYKSVISHNTSTASEPSGGKKLNKSDQSKGSKQSKSRKCC